MHRYPPGSTNYFLGIFAFLELVLFFLYSIYGSYLVYFLILLEHILQYYLQNGCMVSTFFYDLAHLKIFLLYPNINWSFDWEWNCRFKIILLIIFKALFLLSLKFCCCSVRILVAILISDLFVCSVFFLCWILTIFSLATYCVKIYYHELVEDLFSSIVLGFHQSGNSWSWLLEIFLECFICDFLFSIFSPEWLLFRYWIS